MRPGGGLLEQRAVPGQGRLRVHPGPLGVVRGPPRAHAPGHDRLDGHRLLHAHLLTGIRSKIKHFKLKFKLKGRKPDVGFAQLNQFCANPRRTLRTLIHKESAATAPLVLPFFLRTAVKNVLRTMKHVLW